MEENTIGTYVPAPRVRRLAMSLAAGGVVLSGATVLYGAYVVQTAPVAPEQTPQLKPEESILFYQPEEYQDMAPLADVPTELDYLYTTRYLV